MIIATSPKIRVLTSLLLLLTLTISTFAGIQFIPGQGVVLTGADGVVLTGADGVVLTGADGVVLTGADGVVLTGADGVVLTGADSITYTGAEGVVLTGADSTGIKSFDPELAVILSQLPDSSAINVFVVFYRMPTDEDISALKRTGVIGGTRFYNLPMVLINATRAQIAVISTLPSVRSIYSNKTFGFLSTDTREVVGQKQVTTDQVLTRRNGGIPMAGQGVTVAVIDTGIDATHPDLSYAAQVIENVRVADMQSIAPDFVYPVALAGVIDTDLVMGHGTFVASIIAGNGAASGGYYGGLAPASKILGISCGDASLFYVLSGIDYVLSQRTAQNIRVVNCSWGISGIFDANDPINIATKLMHDAGITVVFSSGNRGDQPNSLNPYSVADWVIGVGSATCDGSLSSFSSRGAAGYGMFHPTLVAPGDQVVGARASGINIVGTSGLTAGLISSDNDLKTIPLVFIPRYTTSSGTSFSAPHVAATAALMIQANPSLTPDQVKAILQETATPMLGYSLYEVGAGYLNTYAAVRKAAFGTPYGQFRKSLGGGFSITRQTAISFGGAVAPGASYSTVIDVPGDAFYVTAEVGWSSLPGLENNLELAVIRQSKSYTSVAPSQLGGPTVKKAGVTLTDPSPGQWKVTVTNKGGALIGTTQKFTGAIEVFSAQYSVTGLSQLPDAEQQAAKSAIRAGLIIPSSNSFQAYQAATRLDAARAIMLGAGFHVPQYLPYAPSFSDIGNDANALFVESVTHSPRGNLMGATASTFNPRGSIDRMTVAVAMVKALFSDREIQVASFSNPGLADWDLIPWWARGYISLAVSNGLIKPNSLGNIRAFDSITRIELAMAAVALLEASR